VNARIRPFVASREEACRRLQARAVRVALRIGRKLTSQEYHRLMAARSGHDWLQHRADCRRAAGSRLVSRNIMGRPFLFVGL
jgi:hypothetical protein